MGIAYISDHFTWQEAHCHDGHEVPLEYQPNARRLAVEVLEKVRARFGGPIIPVSWYRSPDWNIRVGGRKHSQHLTASAADIRPVELEAIPRLCAIVESMIVQGELPVLGGLGRYPGWIHVDSRSRQPGEPVVRWFGRFTGHEQ